MLFIQLIFAEHVAISAIDGECHFSTGRATAAVIFSFPVISVGDGLMWPADLDNGVITAHLKW